MVAGVIPTPWTIGHRVWSSSGEPDAHGNVEDVWADPVAVAVHAVSPRLSDEPVEARRHLVVEGLTVYAPAGTQVGEHDRVVWPFIQDGTGAVLLAGDEFEVDGPVADWTSGPWSNPVAGVTFDLNRVEG